MHLRSDKHGSMLGMMGVVERIVPVPESYSAEYLRVNAGTTYNVMLSASEASRCPAREILRWRSA